MVLSINHFDDLHMLEERLHDESALENPLERRPVSTDDWEPTTNLKSYLLLGIGIVTDRPHALEDPAVQALQKRAHKIAKDGKAQETEERAEDDDIVIKLVSAATSSEFRTATGASPRQYVICRQQKSCD